MPQRFVHCPTFIVHHWAFWAKNVQNGFYEVPETMRKFYYLLLVVLVLVDAWLLAHPNLVGKLGIWFYKYDYLKTFPRALATVGSVVLAVLALGWAARQYLPRTVGMVSLGTLAVGLVVTLVQTVVQFSSGTYQFTGAGFKTGAVMLPVLLLLVTAEALLKKAPHPPEGEKKFPNAEGGLRK